MQPPEAYMNQNTDSSPSPKLVDDPLIRGLAKSIRYAVRILAVLMVLVIWWGVADVIYVLYARISTHPYYLLNIGDIFATFGAFMAVLIAIEIFINIASFCARTSSISSSCCHRLSIKRTYLSSNPTHSRTSQL